MHRETHEIVPTGIIWPVRYNTQVLFRNDQRALPCLFRHTVGQIHQAELFQQLHHDQPLHLVMRIAHFH